MQKNFSLTQNMQISRDNSYTGASIVNDFDIQFENASKNYDVHRKQEIKEFMLKHEGLLDYLSQINPIIERYFPDYKKCLTFYRDPEFSSLNDVVVFICCNESSFDINWKKLDQLQFELFKIDNFSNKLKKLLAVELLLS